MTAGAFYTEISSVCKVSLDAWQHATLGFRKKIRLCFKPRGSAALSPTSWKIFWAWPEKSATAAATAPAATATATATAATATATTTATASGTAGTTYTKHTRFGSWLCCWSFVSSNLTPQPNTLQSPRLDLTSSPTPLQSVSQHLHTMSLGCVILLGCQAHSTMIARKSPGRNAWSEFGAELASRILASSLRQAHNISRIWHRLWQGACMASRSLS